MRQVTPSLLIAALCALIVMPGASPAAVTLGEVGTDGPGCPTATTVIQAGTPSGAPSYVVPSPGGVITAWSYQPGATTDRVALVAYSGPVASTDTTTSYEMLASTDVETVSPGPTPVFLTRIPVAAGVHIGVRELDPGSGCSHTTSDTSDLIADCGGCSPTPFDPFVSTTSAPMARVNVSAVLEPDVDHDGYGDETQDQCVGDPNTFDQPCRSEMSVSLAAPATVAGGTEFALQITVTNGGPSIAHDVVVSYRPPAGLHFVSGHSDSHCNGDDTLVTCGISVMSSPSSLPAYIALMPAQQGAFTSTVTVASANRDPNPANNTASAVTTVGPPLFDSNAPPPFAGLKIADNQVLSPDAKRVIAVRASCPAPATTSCIGTLTLRSQGKVAFPRKKGSKRAPPSGVLTLGSAKFSIQVKKSGTVRVKVSATAVRILRRELSLDVVGTAVSRDAAAHAKTTTGQLVVTPPSPARAKRKKKH
jgi:uncharacterized repeat protein (TIGR01451 family)